MMQLCSAPHLQALPCERYNSLLSHDQVPLLPSRLCSFACILAERIDDLVYTSKMQAMEKAAAGAMKARGFMMVAFQDQKRKIGGKSRANNLLQTLPTRMEMLRILFRLAYTLVCGR